MPNCVVCQGEIQRGMFCIVHKPEGNSTLGYVQEKAITSLDFNNDELPVNARIEKVKTDPPE
jgi:hypothetical protein